MTIAKFVNKIIKMNSKEVYFRLKSLGRKKYEDFVWRINKNADLSKLYWPAFLKDEKIQHIEFPKPDLNFFGLADDANKVRSTYDKYFNDNKKDLTKIADELSSQNFHFLGCDVSYPKTISWCANPMTGIEYPHEYSSRIPVYETDQFGDIKYLWELNRHQFFIELAKAYYLTQNNKYAERIVFWLEDWINKNPYKIGVNWTSALEATMRVFSWTWAYYFTQNSPVWTKERKKLLVSNLILHGVFIEEKLSWYFSPYNHLIGELAALALLGILFPSFYPASEWREKYWLALEEQIGKQFHSDGMTVEQATYYHHYTLGFYLKLSILRQQNDLPVSSRTWQGIELALETSMHFTRPDGKLPMIGDIDNARSIYFYRPEDQWHLTNFLSVGAVVFKRSDFKSIISSKAEDLLWLLGVDGANEFEELSSSNPQNSSKYFNDSGYILMRDGWDQQSNYCCIDCGEIADGVHKDNTPSAAHGHADILSFELSIQGNSILIDPGFHTYFGSLDWHRYFRSTRGHNLIEVDGHGQAKHEGRIAWSKVSSPQNVCFLSSEKVDFFSGEIDRFAELSLPISHQRAIVFFKNLYFLIIDQVDDTSKDKSKHLVESFLHFAPGTLKIDDKAFIYNGQNVGQVAAHPNSEINVKKGGTDTTDGWIATGYGYLDEAPVARLDFNQQLPFDNGFLFYTPEFLKKKPKFERAEISEEIADYNISYENGHDKIRVNKSQTLQSIPGSEFIKSDAQYMICLILNKQQKEIYLINAKEIYYNEEQLITSEKNQVNALLSVDAQEQYSIEYL